MYLHISVHKCFSCLSNYSTEMCVYVCTSTTSVNIFLLPLQIWVNSCFAIATLRAIHQRYINYASTPKVMSVLNHFCCNRHSACLQSHATLMRIFTPQRKKKWRSRKWKVLPFKSRYPFFIIYVFPHLYTDMHIRKAAFGLFLWLLTLGFVFVETKIAQFSRFVCIYVCMCIGVLSAHCALTNKHIFSFLTINANTSIPNDFILIIIIIININFAFISSIPT